MSKIAYFLIICIVLTGFVCFAESGDVDVKQESLEIRTAVNSGEIGLKEGIKRCRRLIKKHPGNEVCAGAYYDIGSFFEKIGKRYKAVAAYEIIVEDYSKSEWFSPAVDRLYCIASHLLSLEEKSLFKDSYGEAREIFAKILEAAPHMENAGEIRYKIGVCSLKIGAYEEAASGFREIIEDFPEEPWLEKAVYQLGVVFFKQVLPAQRDQTMTGKGIGQFLHFLKEYPESRFAESAKEKLSVLTGKKAESLYSICRFYHKRKEGKAVLFYCGELLRCYPDTEWAELARELQEAW